jgi:hypothetical protein
MTNSQNDEYTAPSGGTMRVKKGYLFCVTGGGAERVLLLLGLVTWDWKLVHGAGAGAGAKALALALALAHKTREADAPSAGREDTG